MDITLPDWAERFGVDGARYATDRDRMQLAVELSRANVEHRTGGPFGAAVFHRGSGAIAGLGMNLVLALQNSVLHAEVVALMMAERTAGSFRLDDAAGGYELVTSCEPCAMCVAAMHIAGIAKLYYAASLAQSGEAFEGVTVAARHPIDVEALRIEAGSPFERRRLPAEQKMDDEAVRILSAWAAPRRTA